MYNTSNNTGNSSTESMSLFLAHPICMLFYLLKYRSGLSRNAESSDATIYRPNDISSRYWPYRIVSISSRKISKFRHIVIVSISFQYRRNDVDVVYLFSFL